MRQIRLPPDNIVDNIHIVRRHRVMFDSDLANLYGVTTKALNQAVKRNIKRFPDDFMFQLTAQELNDWRSQIVTSNPTRKMGLRRPPYAFSAFGVCMLSSVLSSEKAIQVNIAIMRAFSKMRTLLASHKQLARRLDALEARSDQRFREIFQTIRALMMPPASSTRRIGFK